MSLASGLELVAFDLDNTLYDEGLWYEAALPPIADHLAARSGRLSPEIHAFLRARLRAKGRHYNRLFDDAPSARRDVQRCFIGIALIRTALGAKRNRLPEVVELRVAAITGVLSSQLRHGDSGSPSQKTAER